MTIDPWYLINNVNVIDTPALVVFPDRVSQNIDMLISLIDDKSRLRPHIKTHKTKEVVLMLQAAGIHKFKCATIAEAELLGICQAKDVLLAYQPIGKKMHRFFLLMEQYPNTHFSCLIDSLDVAEAMSAFAVECQKNLSLFIDLNVGMNRTGISPDHAFDLYQSIKSLPGIDVIGLHPYDGHIYDHDYAVRKQRCDAAYEAVELLVTQIKNEDGKQLVVVVGGTPTFPIHAARPEVECSPGTFVYWDYGYQNNYLEQKFIPAALVITKVISKPSENKICVDLGHKSIASENPLDRRIHFLNAPQAKFVSHSEEHMVLEVEDVEKYNIGDVLYGLPIHICPTCALYERAYVVHDGIIIGKEWMTLARDRKINL
jgi:D-threonine aldolase